MRSPNYRGARPSRAWRVDTPARRLSLMLCPGRKRRGVGETVRPTVLWADETCPEDNTATPLRVRASEHPGEVPKPAAERDEGPGGDDDDGEPAPGLGADPPGDRPAERDADGDHRHDEGDD